MRKEPETLHQSYEIRINEYKKLDLRKNYSIVQNRLTSRTKDEQTSPKLWFLDLMILHSQFPFQTLYLVASTARRTQKIIHEYFHKE